MPDRDIFTKIAVPEWRTPLRFLHGSATPAEVAQACLRGVARALRMRGGVVQLNALAGILSAFLRQETTLAEAVQSMMVVERQSLFERHTRMAAASARGLLAQLSPSQVEPSDLQLLLAHTCLRDMIASQVFEVTRPELSEYRFQGVTDQRSDFEAACWEEIDAGGRLQKLAERLCADPSGRSVRLPAARNNLRRSTAEWLTQSLT